MRGLASSLVLSPEFGARFESLYDWEIRYGGYRFDSESELYQVRFRYLHSGLGRWMSRDPVEEERVSNLYWYADNKPINLIDEMGLQPTQWNGTVLGAKWEFVPKKIRCGKNKRDVLAASEVIGGSTYFHGFGPTIKTTSKGCQSPKVQLVSERYTYVIEYWYEKSAKTYEEQNVEVAKNYFVSLAQKIDGLGGCVCPRCAACRLSLADAYRQLAQLGAEAQLAYRDCTMQGIAQACDLYREVLPELQKAIQLTQERKKQCDEIESGGSE